MKWAKYEQRADVILFSSESSAQTILIDTKTRSYVHCYVSGCGGSAAPTHEYSYNMCIRIGKPSFYNETKLRRSRFFDNRMHVQVYIISSNIHFNNRNLYVYYKLIIYGHRYHIIVSQ